MGQAHRNIGVSARCYYIWCNFIATRNYDPRKPARHSRTSTPVKQMLSKLCSVLEEKIRIDNTMAIELDRIREELRIQREIGRRER